MSKTVAAAGIVLTLCARAAVADHCAGYQSVELATSSEDATHDYFTGNAEWSDQKHRWWQLELLSLDSEDNKNVREFVHSFSNVSHYGYLSRSWRVSYVDDDDYDKTVGDTAVANFYAQQSSLTAYDYETALISWLAEDGSITLG